MLMYFKQDNNQILCLVLLLILNISRICSLFLSTAFLFTLKTLSLEMSQDNMGKFQTLPKCFTDFFVYL